MFAFVLLPISAVLVGLSFGGLILHSRAMRTLVSNREVQTVHTAADAIGARLDQRSQAVRAAAALADALDSPAQALSETSFLLNDFEGGLALTSPAGEILASTGPVRWSETSLAPLVVRSQTSGLPEFSETVDLEGVDGVAVLVAFTAHRYAAVGAFLPGTLAAAVLDDAFPPDSQANAWMTDASGTVLYRRMTQPSSTDEVHLAGLAPALRGRAGVTFSEHGGEEYVVAYRPVPTTGWPLILEEPWEAVDNPLLRQTQAAPLVLIPALLLTLFTLGFAIRFVVQPLRTLERRAASVGEADLEALRQPVGGIAEIRWLQRTLYQMASRLRTYQESLRRYAGAVTRSMEDERRRVARDLHDDTIQALIALDQQAQLALKAAEDNPDQLAQHLRELRRQTQAVVGDIRRVIRALRPIYLEDLGLPAALEMLAEDTGQTAGIPVAFRSQGTPRRLHPDQEIAVFRIAQEALANVARHAQAGKAELALTFSPERFSLTIRDDGVGFSLPDPTLQDDSWEHFGLMGMKERAGLIRARLEVTSVTGEGTRVSLDLPLGDQATAGSIRHNA